MDIKCICSGVKLSQCNLNAWLLRHRAPFLVAQKDDVRKYNIKLAQIPNLEQKNWPMAVNILNAQCEFCEMMQNVRAVKQSAKAR